MDKILKRKELSQVFIDVGLDNINDIDVGNIICRLLEENIQLYFDSSRNEFVL